MQTEHTLIFLINDLLISFLYQFLVKNDLD